MQDYDDIQKRLYERCVGFINKDHDRPVCMGLSKMEAYVVTKALEDQSRYLNPMYVIETSDD